MDEKNIRVLIADDESDFRQMMKFWLQARGYSVLEAGDGKAAADMVKEHNPDVIFMDLRMPVMDGAEAIKKIRDFDKEVPIIMISAYVTDPKIKDIMPYDVSGIFYKGKDFQDGLTLLEAALRTHKKLKK